MKKEKRKNNKHNIKKIVLIVLLVYMIVTWLIYNIKEGFYSKKEVFYAVGYESEYLLIDECIRKYASALKDNNAEEVLNLYESNYKKENDITKNNVLNNIKLSNYYRISEIYKSKNRYYVNGELYSKENNAKEEFKIMVILYNDNTFAVIPKVDEKLIKEGIL